MRFRPDPLPYDPDADLTPIAVIAEAPFVIAASSKFGPSNLQELQDYAKANPGAVNTGVSGLGGSGHMAATVLAYTMGLELTYVPYAGVGERLADLMAGRLDIATGIGASGYLPGISSETLKPIAVLGRERLAELPDTPTSIEQGFPETLVSGWYLIAGPGGFPDEITNTMNEVVVEYLGREEVQEKMLEIGNIAATSTVEGVQEKIVEGNEQLGALIDAGLFAIP
jgi:tripartite-type tricarboxylate transporter receptor subunit TctC